MTTPLTDTSGPPPARFNLARHCLAGPAAATPEKIALIVMASPEGDREGTERWTYVGLDTAVRAIAAGLRAEGLRAGDRILLRLPNTSDYALLFLGAVAAGLVPIPVSAQLTESEARFLLADSAAAAIAQTAEVALAAVDPTAASCWTKLRSHA